MKRIRYIILIVFIPALFSCEDFLDKQPTDVLSPTTFWKTQDDATMALAGVYRRAQYMGISGCRRQQGPGRVTGLAHWDNFSDNGYDWNNHANIRNISSGLITPTSGGFISAIYYGSYEGIQTCNNFLANVDNIENADQGLITQYKAEVRFLRAFMYYWLTQSFGDVTLVTEPLSIKDMNIPRTPKADVLSYMYEDLDFAISNLPDEAYDDHAVKASAIALKARVKLFDGEFQDAASLSKQIIDGGKYFLAQEYRSNFCEDFDQDNCPEIIFSFKYSGPDIPNEVDMVIGWWNATPPLPNYIDSHEEGDMRLKWNVAQVGEAWPIGGNYIGWDTLPPNYWCPVKAVTLKWSNPSTNAANQTIRGNDIVQLRFAEVLLVYAEAQNEAVGPDGGVYEAVNLVRQRSGLGDLTAGFSQEEMRQLIRNERRVELAFEGQRFFDLKRWDIAKDIIPTLNYPPDQTEVKRIWEDHFLLWPIPQEEIDKDPENMVQNPGYG